MGRQFKPIQEFQSNGNHAVEDTSENFELEMLEAFIRSQYQLKLGDDFISPYGNRFLHAIFTIRLYLLTKILHIAIIMMINNMLKK